MALCEVAVKKMPNIVPIVTEKEISNKVADLARRISEDYSGRQVVLVGVLKGAFVFMADLMRRLSIPCKVDFIRVASYGSSTVSSGNVRLLMDVSLDVADRDVILVEDIVDSGLTLKFLKEHMLAKKPRSVSLCAMIDKPERRRVDLAIDYVCVQVPEGFLVGYGLDCNEEHRELPGICEIKP
ncbi:MAG: hypoxanthine phosphoribosyltransferase [Thermodesulfobacteriota bacterium]